MSEKKELLHVQTIQSEAVKSVFETLKEIIHDCNLIADKDGLKIFMMDPSQSTLVHLNIYAENCNLYYCAKKMCLGISIPSFYKLLKLIDKNDVLTFKVYSGEEDILHVDLHNSAKKSVRKIKYKLLDLEEEKLDFPVVEFQSIIRMPSSDFQQICRAESIINDVIEISTNNDRLIIRCYGDFASSERILGESLEDDDGIHFTKKNDSEEIVQGKYALRSLLLFTKATNVHSSVELFLKNDFPIIIQYQVADLGLLKFAQVQIND